MLDAGFDVVLLLACVELVWVELVFSLLVRLEEEAGFEEVLLVA